ncbi:MAG: DmsC/YnfH family molybdoenzyme membrane anchor subunit [Pseudomonadota bacterium]
MHPAYSVIIFTTASGAGYGLIILLASFGIAGDLPLTAKFGLVSLLLATSLVAVGLLSSTVHLGRPERAWRAFSQWRSSWLSREGVAAVVTFLPIAVFGFGWVFLNQLGGVFLYAAIAAIGMAIVTVSCTGMIYASLKTIPQWRNPLVLPVYLTLGLATGALLLIPLSAAFGSFNPAFAAFASAFLIVGLLEKLVYWRMIDHRSNGSNIGTATGLSSFGKVSLLEMPHTEENFIMREMGYQIARKHARRLRHVATATLFVFPIALCLLVLVAGEGAALPIGILCVLVAAIGVGVERWLFFAEATHVSMLYYGQTV